MLTEEQAMALTRYGELRNQLMRQTFPSVFAPAVLRDADSNYVPIPVSERLVQCIWYDQRLQPDALQTAEGRRLRVIFPGWWNLEAGPDFRHATVKFDDEPEVTGDVEVHLRADDWVHHGHERDPQFNDVVLHVVLWEAGSQHRPKTHAGQAVPQLVLQHQLAAPLESLYDDIDMDAYPHAAAGHSGRCAQVLKELPAAAVGSLLDAAGDERFAIKTRKFARWIHRAGPEQAFYEGWMEALGYKNNKTAFRTLAQRLPLAELAQNRSRLAALLFGVGNFLPSGAPTWEAATARYVKRLWSQWWKCWPDFEDRILPAESWRCHGIRPANHPQRRLGAAVALLTKHPKFLEKVVGAIESGGDPAKFFANIRDDYWSYHFTLGSKTQSRVVELIGASRAQEIVTNVVLPFVAALAENQADDGLRAKAKARYDALRAGPSNAVTRLAGMQLFEAQSTARKIIKTARQQQGLMQIFQDFCLNDKSACHQCQFPELARRWGAVTPATR
jgi:hypothetical protein